MIPQSHLAPIKRRVAAFLIDSLLLLFAIFFTTAWIEEIGGGIGVRVAVAFAVFVAYHCAGLIKRNYGVGRVAMAISVVSLQSGPGLSYFQCLMRPFTRAVWFLIWFFVSAVVKEPVLMCAPVIIDLVLIALLPMRQTVTDLICRTTVMNTPPIQPH